MSKTTVFSVIFALAVAADASAQPVAGKVDAAGFGAAVGRVARVGQWTPILCDLRVQLGPHFQGELSCETIDLDGDRVSFKSPLVLTAGGGDKRVWLYIASLGDFPETIDVKSEDGVTITTLDIPEILPISNNYLLILDISAPAAGIDQLQTPGLFTGDDSTSRRYYRDIVVSHMSAKQLPDRWWGLEAVNVIVWDKPNPADLNDAQMRALIRWVRNGGQLVIGLGEAWPAVRSSPLADILPLKGAQPSITTQQLNGVHPPELFSKNRAEFDAPIVICNARRRSGVATAMARLSGLEPVDLIVSDSVGSGRVVALTAGIADLMKPMKSANQKLLFMRECFDLNKMRPEWLSVETQMFLPDRQRPLFGAITKAIGFGRRGQFLRIAVIVFVIGYIALSTIATWWWLKRRSMTSFSWTAFAACAVAGSFLSLATVGMSRGFSKVYAVTVYDMEADSKRARGPCWFGYRSPTRQRVALTLPGEQNYLRALSLADQPHYATPLRYAAYAAQARLDDTPMRASLKQFEGYWVGSLDGTVAARLTVARGTGRISPDSSISNELPVNIVGGWLLYLDPRLPDAVYKPAGYEKRVAGRVAVPAENVLLVKIAALSVSARTDQPLGATESQAASTAQRRWAQTNRQPPRPDLAMLRDGQLNWMATLGGTIGALVASDEQQFQAAAMLASTRNLYLHMNRSLKGVDAIIETAGLVDMDITHWLSKDQAVLILFSDEAGPATLDRDGKEMKSAGGHSVYRVRVPITRQGRPPSPVGPRSEGETP